LKLLFYFTYMQCNINILWYVVANDPTYYSRLKSSQGLVVVGFGEKGGSVRINGEGNLYSGQSVTGGNGGNITRGGELPILGIVGAISFLLAWTLLMDKSDKAMKKNDKRNTRKEAILVVYIWSKSVTRKSVRGFVVMRYGPTILELI